MQFEKSLIEVFCVTSMIITMLELFLAKMDDVATAMERILTKLIDLVRRWRK
jgi:hypothetical protein